jgi:hypothetical protein
MRKSLNPLYRAELTWAATFTPDGCDVAALSVEKDEALGPISDHYPSIR